MILYRNENVRICISDIETLKTLTHLGFYNPDTGERMEFEISEFRNDLFSFVSFYRKKDWDFICGYNFISFDAQVIQYMLNHHQEWVGADNLQIVTDIYRFAQDLIEGQNYGVFLPYREEQFEIPVIDVYKILGLDNEARRSSLKKCEFQLDMPNIEEMPIHHTADSLSQEDIKMIVDYERYDILATYELLKLVIGDTNHPVYKQNNQLSLRKDIQDEFEINCLNFSDIKIGDEIIKHSYAKAIGKKIWELPKKGFFRKDIKLKNCIPAYIEFKTPQLQQLFKGVKKEIIRQTDKFERKITFYNRKYTLAKGGFHADQSNEVWEANDNYYIEDDDISSFYPKIIINNEYFPYHLGKELLNVYETIYNKRVELKPQAKKDKKIKGIVEALKLSLNSVFGKLGSMESWLYDAQTLFSVTLTGEFTILMLIEEFELNGIPVISANTDGVTTRFPKEKKELKDKIVKEWQEKTNFEIETVRFKKFFYSTVNDYLAIKDDGEIKKKGQFITNHELWKNKSLRIIPLALEAYFVNGINPREFIPAHKNIYDFCILGKATGNTHIEERWEEEGEQMVKKHKKLVRYYYSGNSGRILYKAGIGTTGKKMNNILAKQNDIGDIYMQYFNRVEEKPFLDYGVATEHYILRTLKFIDKIQGSKLSKNYIHSLAGATQIAMF